MRCARPSTIAVLPTPGSPISTGLFLVRRCSTWIARRISSSRPITGSSLPLRARSVRSIVYFLSASRWPSASGLSTFWPPRTASIAASSDLREAPNSFSSRADRRLRLRRRDQEQLARDELVAALVRLLLGRLEQRRQIAARLDRLAPLHLRQALQRVLERGLDLAGVDAGARQERLRAVGLGEHRGEHVDRLDVGVVAGDGQALRFGERLLERRRQFVESHGGDSSGSLQRLGAGGRFQGGARRPSQCARTAWAMRKPSAAQASAPTT